MKKDQKASDESRARMSESRKKFWAKPGVRELESEKRKQFWASERGERERQRRLLKKQATLERKAAVAKPPKPPKKVKVELPKEPKVKRYVSRKNPPRPPEWEIRDRLAQLGKLNVAPSFERSSEWVHPRLREAPPPEFPEVPSTPATVRKYRINRKTRVPILISNRYSAAARVRCEREAAFFEASSAE